MQNSQLNKRMILYALFSEKLVGDKNIIFHCNLMILTWLVAVKSLSTIMLTTVILIVGHWRYKKETMRYQFESLLGQANAFVSGLLMSSSLVYLLPESYKQHNLDLESESIEVAEDEFPWMFSVFCGSFAVVTILTQFFSFDKFFRQRVIDEILYYEKTMSNPNQHPNHTHSEIDLDHSSYKPVYQQHIQTQKLYPRESIVSPWLSYAPSSPNMNGIPKHFYTNTEEDDAYQQTNGNSTHQQKELLSQNMKEQNHSLDYNPQILFLINCIHSFFECSAIGLQQKIFSTIIICLSVLLHKWFEVLFIQIQIKISPTFRLSTKFACNSQSFLIFLFALVNISGLIFGWVSLNFMYYQVQAVFLSISAGTLFAISINDLLHAEINKGNKNRFQKIFLFIFSVVLINVAWFAEKQI